MRTKKSLGLPRKALAKWGQHFLRDPKILKKIAIFAQIDKEDVVVEVGPGEGTLTKILLERAKKVIAVEKDEGLADKLKQNFSEEILNNRLKIIVGDVLKLKAKSLELRGKENLKALSSQLQAPSYVLVGNIPYYITGALFKKFLESENPPKSITFVVQKEVAERIMGSHFAKASRDKSRGKESILSISIKAYGEPEYGGIIRAGSFYPKPKVDSAIIAIRNVNKERFEEITPLTPLTLRGGPEKKFFEILKRGFAHKRKLLMKNLGGVSKGIFDTCGIPEKARAENLSVDNWICLTKSLL